MADLLYRDVAEAAFGIEARLVMLSQVRAYNTELVDDAGKQVPAWVVNERSILLSMVNRLRAARWGAPVGPEAMRRAEDQAVGHADYRRKLSWALAELAMGGDHD
jgi:hypothetical protein